MLWRAGLRVSEALALRAGDVELELGELRVLHGKGDRARTVGLDPLAAAIVARWSARRLEYPRPKAGALFCTITRGGAGGPVSSSYVRQALARAARRAGVEKAVRPHGLRHTHAAELAREGVPMHLIRRQLGHARLDTTARYVDHLAPREVIDAMRARSGSVELERAELDRGPT